MHLQILSENGLGIAEGRQPGANRNFMRGSDGRVAQGIGRDSTRTRDTVSDKQTRVQSLKASSTNCLKSRKESREISTKFLIPRTHY